MDFKFIFSVRNYQRKPLSFYAKSSTSMKTVRKSIALLKGGSPNDYYLTYNKQYLSDSDKIGTLNIPKNKWVTYFKRDEFMKLDPTERPPFLPPAANDQISGAENDLGRKTESSSLNVNDQISATEGNAKEKDGTKKVAVFPSFFQLLTNELKTNKDEQVEKKTSDNESSTPVVQIINPPKYVPSFSQVTQIVQNNHRLTTPIETTNLLKQNTNKRMFQDNHSFTNNNQTPPSIILSAHPNQSGLSFTQSLFMQNQQKTNATAKQKGKSTNVKEELNLSNDKNQFLPKQMPIPTISTMQQQNNSNLNSTHQRTIQSQTILPPNQSIADFLNPTPINPNQTYQFAKTGQNSFIHPNQQKFQQHNIIINKTTPINQTQYKTFSSMIQGYNVNIPSIPGQYQYPVKQISSNINQTATGQPFLIRIPVTMKRNQKKAERGRRRKRQNYRYNDEDDDEEVAIYDSDSVNEPRRRRRVVRDDDDSIDEKRTYRYNSVKTARLAKPPPVKLEKPPDDFEDRIMFIVNVGYPYEYAKNALSISNYDTEIAIKILKTGKMPDDIEAENYNVKREASGQIQTRRSYKRKRSESWDSDDFSSTEISTYSSSSEDGYSDNSLGTDESSESDESDDDDDDDDDDETDTDSEDRLLK